MYFYGQWRLSRKPKFVFLFIFEAFPCLFGKNKWPLVLNVFEFEPSKSYFLKPHPFSIGFKSYGVWVRKSLIKRLLLQKKLLGSSPNSSFRIRSWLYSVPVITRTKTRRIIRTSLKYTRKEYNSVPKFCKTT